MDAASSRMNAKMQKVRIVTLSYQMTRRTVVRAQYVAKAQYVTIVTYWAQNAKFDWIFKNSAQYVAKFFL